MPLVSSLKGTEVLEVTGVAQNGQLSGQTETCTTQQIANLASNETSGTKITTISTVGNGTLTAAGIVGKIISRTGSQTALFTDTTDTAAAIIAALPSAVVGATFSVRILNTTGWGETITNGSGVTISGNTSIPSNSWNEYLLKVTSASAVSLTYVDGGPLNNTLFDTINQDTLVNTSTASAITNTTLALVPGLSTNVTALGTYSVYAYLATAANATAGIKVAIGGTATAASANLTAKNYNTTTLNAVSNTTTFGNAVGGANAVTTLVEIEGVVAVASGGAGTLGVEFAQNTSNGAAPGSQVLLNSYLQITRVS
jgi:hypothetical protein